MLNRRLYFKILIGTLIAFLAWGLKEEVRAMLLTPPETCALCGQGPQEVPCLLDISTGQVGNLAGGNSPDQFQFIGLPGAVGTWDSHTRSGQVTLSLEDPQFLVPLFCRSCRWTILGNPPRDCYLADLSDPSHPLLYPPEEGVYSIAGYEVLVSEERSDTLSLLIYHTS